MLLTISFGAVFCLQLLAASIFGDVEPLNTNADSDVELDAYPSVASDGAGNLVAAWSSSNLQGQNIGDDGDIFVARSSDNGVTWGDPIPITIDDAADQIPSIATDGDGNWVVVWLSNNDLGGTIGVDYDILFSRSTNNGATWSTPTFLNSAAPTSNASDGDPIIVSGGPDLFIVSWFSNANIGSGVDFDVHYARSKDGGGSWSEEDALNPDSDTDVNKFDQLPALASDGQGNWVALWLGAGEDSVYEVLAARSTNDGKTWKDQQSIGLGSGQPRIAYDGAGNFVAVWHLYDPENELVDDNDIVVSFTSDLGNDWSATEFLNSNAETDAHNDQEPVIASDGAGTWLVTWSSNNPLDGGAAGDWDILESRSTDEGDTWTAPKQLHNNAADDLGSDVNPTVVSTGPDSWFVAWESYESFDGSIGSDADIVFARGFPSTYTILSPNGGESWKIGKKAKIEWDSSANLGKVKLVLLKNGIEITTIKSKTKDDGLQKWEVPAGIGTGTGFSVRIEAVGDSTNADESDGTFKVKSGK